MISEVIKSLYENAHLLNQKGFCLILVQGTRPKTECSPHVYRSFEFFHPQLLERRVFNDLSVEDQAFQLSYDLPPPAPRHQVVYCTFLSLPVLPVELTDGRRGGVGEEPNHTTAAVRKSGPLLIIQYLLVLTIGKVTGQPR